MTAGDDEDNDPMLRGMRSVWLEMRDEEPPSGGLADLMAAARAQAAVMKPAEEEAPWWRRAFAMMVRPPMLAAATVLVLIGGAVVLKGRGADEAAMPTSSTFGEQDRKGMAEPVSKKKQDSDAEAPTDTPAPAIVAPVPTEASPGYGSGTARQAGPAPMTPRARPTADPKASYQPPPKKVTKNEEQKKEADAVVEDNKDTKSDRSDRAPPRVQQQPGLEIANEGDAGVGGKAPDTTSVRTSRQPPAKTGESAPGRREVTTDQLVKQTETAAGRGDCAAVRVTAERIKKLDANTYKRIATQPTIARCLK